MLIAVPGSPEANSYLTVEEADDIAAERGLGPAAAGWLNSILSDKEKALIRATGELDAHLGSAGIRSSLEQALLFPRYVDVQDDVLYIIPSVRLATYEQAVYVLHNAEVIDNANTRRARGLISFSDDDGSGSVLAASPTFSTMSPQALMYIGQIRGLGRATLYSVKVSSSYKRRGSLLDLQ
jgi:Putative DnaT-like ssDNA binding protein